MCVVVAPVWLGCAWLLMVASRWAWPLLGGVDGWWPWFLGVVMAPLGRMGVGGAMPGDSGVMACGVGLGESWRLQLCAVGRRMRVCAHTCGTAGVPTLDGRRVVACVRLADMTSVALVARLWRARS